MKRKIRFTAATVPDEDGALKRDSARAARVVPKLRKRAGPVDGVRNNVNSSGGDLSFVGDEPSVDETHIGERVARERVRGGPSTRAFFQAEHGATSLTPGGDGGTR
jgi:hypothetical protein